MDMEDSDITINVNNNGSNEKKHWFYELMAKDWRRGNKNNEERMINNFELEILSKKIILKQGNVCNDKTLGMTVWDAV